MSFLSLGSIQRGPRPLPQGLQLETAPASRPIDPGGGDQGAQSDGCADSNERWRVHRLMQPVLADEVGIGTTSGREYFQSLFERMTRNFHAQLSQEFASHNCAEHPRVKGATPSSY